MTNLYTNCPILVIAEDEEIYRVEVNGTTQNDINSRFEEAANAMLDGRDPIPFDGSYKPYSNEYLVIDNYVLPDNIKEALRNPIGVSDYSMVNGSFMKIKAVFMGTRCVTEENEVFCAAFQRFKKEQYLTTNFINLFFQSNAFHRETNCGIRIADNVDCVYKDNKLCFNSFYYARQIFDLNQYYRSATNEEVNAFIASRFLAIENPESFLKMTDTVVRRKIALINDSHVLEDNSGAHIRELAESNGITIELDGSNKIVIPNDKWQLKCILSFLDEETYKGAFTHNVYLTNSKKQIG